jgi:hypothetical protein
VRGFARKSSSEIEQISVDESDPGGWGIIPRRKMPVDKSFLDEDRE